MAKYINAEQLKDSMFAYYDCLNESAKGRPYKGDTLMDYEVVDMIEDCIENAPTAPVVEVVRCRECKHCEILIDQFDNDWYFCKKTRNNAEVTADHFCSYGERK